jgi:hypothetical protein
MATDDEYPIDLTEEEVADRNSRGEAGGSTRR